MPVRAGAPSPSPIPTAAASYLEYPARGALQPFVECFWVREPGGCAERARPTRVHRVLPDGCIDIVLELGPGEDAAPRRAMAVGTMTRALVREAAAADRYLGVRFRPGKAAAFLHVPASELTDLHVPLGDLLPDAASAHDALAGASDAAARVHALERWLADRLTPVAGDDQRDVDEAVRRITAAGGSLGITRLAPALGVSRQHLARRFAHLVGVSPKMFARVVRLRRAIERARAECARAGAAGVNWSALALEAGYFDQPHLVDEFRELTGLTPGAWERELVAGRRP